ncbi:MAG: hypothetical protein GWN61_14155, partial [candidate division Zixibacteria bacterium]|nr:hypothetical protein [candidate division Zixibacteria bacterium]NIS47079.1 hypothetical protein [candidate division Zixibacteria bacterium]NIV07281.1 hypothetical protein [candidate division Zixibacteria bacterium]
EIILTTILNEIAEMSNAIVFVLDDYHVIHNLSIHQQLTFLLDHLPVQFHLVILSREDPLLPIARLRAREQVLEIRQHDLRFTIDEIDEFLVSVMGLSLSSAEIAALERRTEGWIAGLLLAALSMRSREDLSSFIQDFTGSSRFILDYLIEEVFNRQRPEIQNFLLKTSILDRLSGPLCNRVTETANSQGFLENLEQSNLFIVPLDQSRDWYRYHRLFAELLRHRLRMSGVDTAELHTRARKWFEENELQNEAIHHALAAQDWGRASQLIQEVTSDFLKHGEVLTIIKWYESLPGEMLVSDPKLCLDYCWSLLLGTQYEIAAPLLEEVEQAAQGIPVFLGEVYAAQAYLARGVGDHERMLERSQLALEKLPKSSVGSRGIVAVNLGIAYWHMGQMKPSEEAMLEAQEAGKATGNLYVVLTAWIFLGRVLAVRGKLHQAVEYFERAIHQGAGVPITALAYMDLAIINYEWNHLDISEANLHKAISLCEKSQNYEFLTGTLMIQSRLNGARGDFPAANQALEQAWDLVRDGKVPAPTVKRLKVAQARLFISSGNLPIEWRQSLTTSLDCHPNYRFLGVTKALSMPASQARIYLDELSEVALVNDWIYGLITVRALQAVFAQTQDQALDFLTEALRLA